MVLVLCYLYHVIYSCHFTDPESYVQQSKISLDYTSFYRRYGNINEALKRSWPTMIPSFHFFESKNYVEAILENFTTRNKILSTEKLVTKSNLMHWFTMIAVEIVYFLYYLFYQSMNINCCTLIRNKNKFKFLHILQDK